MFASQMLDFRNAVHEEGVVFCYSGYMTEDVLLSIGSVIKKKLAADSVDKKTARGVFSVLVEQVQNVIRYSVEDDSAAQNKGDENDLRYGLVMVGSKDEKYFVACSNVVDKGDVERLREGLNHIQQLDQKGLKALYREILKGNVPEGSKGAGVGFIDIARRATNGIEFDFSDYDENHSYFSLKAYI